MCCHTSNRHRLVVRQSLHLTRVVRSNAVVLEPQRVERMAPDLPASIALS